MRPQSILTAALLALAACTNAGEDLGLPRTALGALGVAVFVDRDGSGTFTTDDSAYAGARVALFIEGGSDTLFTVATDAEGLALFDSVPIGRYRYAVVPGSVGDSLPVITNGTGTFRIIGRLDSLAAGATALVGYPQLTVAQARQAAPGRRVFVRGIVAAGLQSFTDSATFLTSGDAHLRVTSAEHRPGRNGNNPGDSVLVFGTTAVDAGEPVLADGFVSSLAERPAPVPIDVSVAEVRTARGGELDAALVRVGEATIGDTATVDDVFQVEIANGADTALVVLDPKLQVPTQIFIAGRPIVLRGVLVPLGNDTWYLKPRPVTGEIVVN